MYSFSSIFIILSCIRYGSVGFLRIVTKGVYAYGNIANLLPSFRHRSFQSAFRWFSNSSSHPRASITLLHQHFCWYNGSGIQMDHIKLLQFSSARSVFVMGVPQVVGWKQNENFSAWPICTTSKAFVIGNSFFSRWTSAAQSVTGTSSITSDFWDINLSMWKPALFPISVNCFCTSFANPTDSTEATKSSI